MSTKHTTPTPAELAERLIAEATEAVAIEPGNEGLLTRSPHDPGALDAALLALMDNEATKAAGHLRRAIELCALPVSALESHHRTMYAQDQRNRLLNVAAGALALIEQADYRGPDRRTGTDRRDGEDRRHLGTEHAPEVLEQRCGEQRRGGTERRNPLREALYRAGNDAWDAQARASYELVPLLAVAEFAARAHHSLSAFEFWAGRDNTLMERLNDADGEWRTGMDDARTPLHIAQCIGMARTLAERVAGDLDALSGWAFDACEVEARRDADQDAEVRRAAALERLRRDVAQDRKPGGSASA